MSKAASSSSDSAVQRKLEACREILRSLDRVVVAFSAGVDSTFLLALAAETLGPRRVLAAIGEHLPPFWSHGNPVDLVATVAHGVPERVIELVAASDAVDTVLTLALIGSPSSGRTAQGRDDDAAAGGAFAGLNGRERALLTHMAATMESTGKPVVSVPLTPLDRSVFPGLGAYAPVLLPTPGAAVRALAAATWYSRHTAHQAPETGTRSP